MLLIILKARMRWARRRRCFLWNWLRSRNIIEKVNDRVMVDMNVNQNSSSVRVVHSALHLIIVV